MEGPYKERRLSTSSSPDLSEVEQYFSPPVQAEVKVVDEKAIDIGTPSASRKGLPPLPGKRFKGLSKNPATILIEDAQAASPLEDFRKRGSTPNAKIEHFSEELAATPHTYRYFLKQMNLHRARAR